jgi:hypothetical protein
MLTMEPAAHREPSLAQEEDGFGDVIDGAGFGPGDLPCRDVY